MGFILLTTSHTSTPPVPYSLNLPDTGDGLPLASPEHAGPQVLRGQVERSEEFAPEEGQGRIPARDEEQSLVDLLHQFHFSGTDVLQRIDHLLPLTYE